MPSAVERIRGGREIARPRALVWALAAAFSLLVAGVGRAAPAQVRITAAPQGGDLVISISRADGEHSSIHAFTLDNPSRLVFDLANALLPPDHPRTLEVALTSVYRVRMGQNQPNPPVVRVVVDLPEGGGPPAWETHNGEAPGETVIVVHGEGRPALALPEVTSKGDIVLLRFSGVGGLTRRTGALAEPPRLFVDLAGAEVSGELIRDFPDENGLLAQVRLGQQPEEDGKPVARLVVELRKDAAHSVFEDGADLVVAVGPEAWALPLPAYHGAERLKGRTIVVDPGHGGKDTGAQARLVAKEAGQGADCGDGMVLEKDIVLDIAKRLARALEAEGAKVVMTRSDDTYISLRERAAIANRIHADVFVSVHCNSCDRPNTLHGTSVYYDHAHSIPLARAVQAELLAALGTEDKGVRNANFAVIRRTKGPGILVETAFINHADDQRRLLNENFRERAARAIAHGIVEFLNQGGGAKEE